MYNSTYPWYNYSAFIFFLLYLEFHGLELDVFFLPFAYELCSKALLTLPSSQFSGDPDWKKAGMWRGQCLWDRVGRPFWEGQGFGIQLMMHSGEGHLLMKEKCHTRGGSSGDHGTRKPDRVAMSRSDQVCDKAQQRQRSCLQLSWWDGPEGKIRV